jgi:hypothetical protein
VSAAIQKQISRDFGPMWNVEATVDAFKKLEDVPIGYWHVLLQDEFQMARRVCTKRTLVMQTSTSANDTKRTSEATAELA